MIDILVTVLLLLGMSLFCIHHYFNEEVKLLDEKISSSYKKTKEFDFESLSDIECNKVVSYFERKIGPPLSLSSLKTIGIASTVFSTLYLIVMFLVRYQMEEGFRLRVGLDNFPIDTAFMFFAYGVGTSFFNWVSYAVTFFLISYMIKVLKKHSEKPVDDAASLIYDGSAKKIFRRLLYADVFFLLAISLISIQVIFSAHDIFYYQMYGQLQYKDGNPSYSNALLMIVNYLYSLLGLELPFREQGVFHFLTFFLALSGCFFTIIHIFIVSAYSENRFLPNIVHKFLTRVLGVYARAPNSAVWFMGVGLIALSQVLSSLAKSLN